MHNTSYPTTSTSNNIIEMINSHKYLGVHVEGNFKWLTHIQHLRKKLKAAAYSLYHLSNSTIYPVLKQAYFSLVESYLRHGITAWGNSTYCSSLQQTQNQIMKILLKSQQHHLQFDLIYGVQNNTIGNNNHTNNTQENNSHENIGTYNAINNNAQIHTNNTNANNNNPNISNNATYENNSDSNINISANNNTHITTHRSVNTQARNPFLNTNTGRSTHTHVNNNLATKLGILNVKSLHKMALINEFHSEQGILKPIDHSYNTRRRAEGRYKVEKFSNNYGKYCINVTLPSLCNSLPVNVINEQNNYKRKKLLKTHFLNSQ